MPATCLNTSHMAQDCCTHTPSGSWSPHRH
jgi:hypothetical protein